MRTTRFPFTKAFACTAAVVVALVVVDLAQTDGLDPEAVALVFHKLTLEPLDLRGAAERSEAARRATNFDRQDAVASELARLQASLAAANAGQEFAITVDDQISQYDHTRNEFSITLFTPGYYVPLEAFGQQYQVVFANAESARAFPMAKDAAREFDAQLNAYGRRVSNQIRFKVVGKGDAAGAVTGARVIRAEITSDRILDQAGRVLFTPQLTRALAAGTPAPAAPAFDASRADVAGLRVGGSVADMEATLTRLFGKVTRGGLMSNSFKGFAGKLEVNASGCFSSVGRRRNPQPGAVCVTAYVDHSDVVRMIQIERLFPPFDADVFRRALIRKYGPAANAQGGGGALSINWGPAVPGAVLGNPSVSLTAVTANYRQDSDFMSAALNQREHVIVSLQLIDAAWAATAAK